MSFHVSFRAEHSSAMHCACLTYVLVFARRIDQLHSVDCVLNGSAGFWRVHEISFDLWKET